MVCNEENKRFVKQVHSAFVDTLYWLCVAWNNHHQQSLEIDFHDAIHLFFLLEDHNVRKPKLSKNAECHIIENLPTLSFKVQTFDGISKSGEEVFVVIQDEIVIFLFLVPDRHKERKQNDCCAEYDCHQTVNGVASSIPPTVKEKI